MMAHQGNRMADWFSHIGNPRRNATVRSNKSANNRPTNTGAPAPVVPRPVDRNVPPHRPTVTETIGASPAGSERGQSSSTRSACAPGIRSETSSNSSASSLSAVTLPRRKRNPSFSAAASLPSLVPFLEMEGMSLQRFCTANPPPSSEVQHSSREPSEDSHEIAAPNAGSDSCSQHSSVSQPDKAVKKPEETESLAAPVAPTPTTASTKTTTTTTAAAAPCADPVLTSSTPTPVVSTQTSAELSPPTISRESYFNIKRLAKAIQSGAFVLFITGAGVSVSSGIKTYRTGPDGLWNNYVYEWGTKRRFLEDPATWWTDFWLKSHDTDKFLNARPSPSHIAIAQIVNAYPNARVVTQNVDRLHLKSGIDPSHLVEVHGAIGLYRCVNPECEYSSRKYFSDIQIEYDANNRVIPPHCPICGSLIMPLTLLFDEHYASHSFFKNDVVCDWLDRAEILVFVGTSFSVGITSAAVQSAMTWGSDVYTFNVEPQHPPGVSVVNPLLNATGPCELTLPMLAHECHADKPAGFISTLTSACKLQ